MTCILTAEFSRSTELHGKRKNQPSRRRSSPPFVSPPQPSLPSPHLFQPPSSIPSSPSSSSPVTTNLWPQYKISGGQLLFQHVTGFPVCGRIWQLRYAHAHSWAVWGCDRRHRERSRTSARRVLKCLLRVHRENLFIFLIFFFFLFILFFIYYYWYWD